VLPAGFVNELPYLAGLDAMTDLAGMAPEQSGARLLARHHAVLLASALRTVDHAVCAQFPIGMHFWHPLSLGVLFWYSRGSS
jgi:hypothetical protein